MLLNRSAEDMVPAGRVLLHTCCAPCSGAILEWMMARGIRPTVYYFNPNIYPYEEYLTRRQECARYAEELGLEWVEAAYDHAFWLHTVQGMEQEPECGRRCMACFRMRLKAAAEYASAHGFQVLTSTLDSSRWKDHGQIIEAGREATAGFPDVTFWEKNWRKGGLQERRQAILREKGFYNQTYCGCEFSRSAQESRTVRSAGRTAPPTQSVI